MVNLIVQKLLEVILKSGKVIDLVVGPFVDMLLKPENEEKLVELFDQLDEKLIDSIEDLAPETHKKVQAALIRVFGKLQSKVND